MLALRRPLAFLAAACLSAGCGGPQGLVSATPQPPSQEQRSLFLASGASLARIHHVVLTLHTHPGEVALASQRLEAHQLGHLVRFTNLAPHTSYRVEARAYGDAAGSLRLDRLEADPGSCTTTFATQDDEVVTLPPLRLSLVPLP